MLHPGTPPNPARAGAFTTMSRVDPSTIIGIFEGQEPEDEADHFMVCPDCGQAFDCRNLGEVMHHSEDGHEPMERPLA